MAMPRVKIISEDNVMDLEHEINKFLKQLERDQSHICEFIDIKPCPAANRVMVIYKVKFDIDRRL